MGGWEGVREEEGARTVSTQEVQTNAQLIDTQVLIADITCHAVQEGDKNMVVCAPFENLPPPLFVFEGIKLITIFTSMPGENNAHLRSL